MQFEKILKLRFQSYTSWHILPSAGDNATTMSEFHFNDPPANFPYKMGGLKATTKWIFMGHFVVGPPCEKVQGPLQLWMARHFVEKKPGPMDEDKN